MRILVLDLETVPCLAMGERVYGIDPNAPDAYEHLLAARLAETEDRTDFLKPAFHRIVAVGVVGIDTEKRTAKLIADAGQAEAALLTMVDHYLDKRPGLVTSNGLHFDLPVLWARSLFHRIPMPNLYGPADAKKWEKYEDRYGDRHTDLQDQLALFDRYNGLRLEEAAALCGLEAKTATTGADVLGLWKAGNLAGIRDYVREDAAVTARIFLRWQVCRGRLEASAADVLDRALQAQFVTAREPELALTT